MLLYPFKLKGNFTLSSTTYAGVPQPAEFQPPRDRLRDQENPSPAPNFQAFEMTIVKVKKNIYVFDQQSFPIIRNSLFL